MLSYLNQLIENKLTNEDLDNLNKTDIEKIKDLIFRKKPYYENNIFFSIISNQELLTYCNKWNLNRNINQTHVNNIYTNYEKQIIDTNNIIINNVISIAFYQNNLYILDGQHRREAILLLQKKYEFNCDIRFDIYEINTFDNMVKILKELNTAYPIDIDKLINNNIILIIDFMKKYFYHKDIGSIISNRIIRPFINENLLIDNIKKHRNILYNTDINIIKNNIIEINNIYKQYNNNKLKFNNNNKITNIMTQKANKTNCYLGFDNNFTWLQIINNKI